METTIRSTYVTMTPGLAQRYLDTMLENRKLNTDWVTALANVIKRGEWVQDGNSIKMDEGGHLIDGQHRLNAVIKAGIPVTMEVKSGFEHSAINIIDTMTKQRSVADIATLNSIKNATAVTSSISAYLLEKAKLQQSGVNQRSTASPVTIMDAYWAASSFWDDIALFAISIYNRSGRARTLRPSFVGGIAAYLIRDKKRDERMVKRFFEGITSYQTSENVVIEALRLKLIANINSQKRFKPSIVRNLVAKGWNAYCIGKPLKMVKYDEKEGRIEFI